MVHCVSKVLVLVEFQLNSVFFYGNLVQENAALVKIITEKKYPLFVQGLHFLISMR